VPAKRNLTALRLLLEDRGGGWYVIGLIHGGWTIE